ncbi:MAG: hypothetical protein GY800_05950 [Planctomycetes bacterium]|nr:hypothetical protein [Planctomycetota bacterium]
MPDLSALSAEAADLVTALGNGTSDLSADSSLPKPRCCKRSGQFMRSDSPPSEIHQSSLAQKGIMDDNIMTTSKTSEFSTRRELRKTCKAMLIIYWYTLYRLTIAIFFQGYLMSMVYVVAD